MFINESNIRKLIRLIEESDIDSIEVSGWGRKVKITQRVDAASNGHGSAPVVMAPQATISPQAARSPEIAPAPAPSETTTGETSRYVEVTSPMVGTFYSAPSPEASPYVSPNEKVVTGQVLCIVEAMKLMNEIESDASGRVVEIRGENGKPVEYGQVLFVIDPEG
ncbi:MAG: acetyl-CoA carboxylase biotin carboxyl carrier protein [candidate division Zixibacteria bacterium]|nr:acetyl-CoA carboxylase biotin carboxyl carrier protein [candidate division Zixibacteria bacterium]